MSDVSFSTIKPYSMQKHLQQVKLPYLTNVEEIFLTVSCLQPVNSNVPGVDKGLGIGWWMGILGAEMRFR